MHVDQDIYNIVDQILKDHISEDPFKREKNINTLMNYIQMVINKMKEQVLQKKLSTVEMLVNPLTVFYIEIVFFGLLCKLQKYNNT